jgi:hypothetical protein
MLLDPLLVLLVVLAIGLVFLTRARGGAEARRQRRWGLALAWVAWGALWLFATPRFSFATLDALEVPPIDVAAALGSTPEERCAMVVLTGGTRTRQAGSAAWQPELLEMSSVPRAIGAARLYRSGRRWGWSS